MSRPALWSVLVAVLLTLAVGAGAFAMLRTINNPGEPTPTAGPEETVTEGASISGRPDCPASGAGGVDLDCLGGAGSDAAPTGITVVNVWAWWCGPCRDELPFFDELAAAHPEYTVVGVHADRNPGNGAALLAELGISLPSYQDLDNRFAGTLGLPGVIPLTVVFDGEEQIALFPRTFASLAELQDAVAGAVASR
ncbi:TlpA family protein disulfide reductase [Corynebacterium nasicanis]|uniref:TlpA family protein disulfide reductase n=1 Tax=Corynebacterium nasicanis TaxID=1448267 RepID=A0ABW1QCS4_9CORY